MIPRSIFSLLVACSPEPPGVAPEDEQADTAVDDGCDFPDPPTPASLATTPDGDDLYAGWPPEGLYTDWEPGLLSGVYEPEAVVWIGTSGSAESVATSSCQAPYPAPDAASLAAALAEIEALYPWGSTGVRIHLLPGTYETWGIRLVPNWQVRGAGADRTSIVRVPSGSDAGNVAVVTGGWGVLTEGHQERYESINMVVSDVTLDANWPAFVGSEVTKASGVSLVARQAVVERVSVTNYGAVGGASHLQEVFPILLSSSTEYDVGVGYYLPYGDSHLVIRDSEVFGPVLGEDGTLAEDWAEGLATGLGPYCTAIGLAQYSADSEGVNRGWVYGNEVHDVVNGIALGGAWIVSATFQGNDVHDVGIGFNFDTGGNHGLVLTGNRFEDVGGGGSLNWSGPVEFSGNTVELAVSELDYYHVGVRLNGWVESITIADNAFSLAYDGEVVHEAFRLEGRDSSYTYDRIHVIEGNEVPGDLCSTAIAFPGDDTSAPQAVYLRVDGEEIVVESDEPYGWCG